MGVCGLLEASILCLPKSCICIICSYAPKYFLQESKLYGAHFREIGENAPKATKIKFGDSDEES